MVCPRSKKVLVERKHPFHEFHHAVVTPCLNTVIGQKLGNHQTLRVSDNDLGKEAFSRFRGDFQEYCTHKPAVEDAKEIQGGGPFSSGQHRQYAWVMNVRFLGEGCLQGSRVLSGYFSNKDPRSREHRQWQVG